MFSSIGRLALARIELAKRLKAMARPATSMTPQGAREHVGDTNTATGHQNAPAGICDARGAVDPTATPPGVGPAAGGGCGGVKHPPP